jgi:SpoVK/Ycf46/Vps4 family AAA+-type ATPase
MRMRLAKLANLPLTNLPLAVIHLSGRNAPAVAQAAQFLTLPSDLRLLCVELPPLIAANGLEAALTIAEREAALQRAALLLMGLHQVKAEDALHLRRRFEVARLAPLVFLASDGSFAWPGLNIALPEPDFEARRDAWERHLAAEAPGLVGAVIDGLAGKFKLSVEQIGDAAQIARGHALWRDPLQPVLTPDDLYAAARSQSTPILSSLARKIVPRFNWDDIVLPPDTRLQLREMCNHVEHRHTVYHRWGLERKLGLGQGLMALFAGQSGTGKTMAADILAGQLGLDLYKIDLSGVVSKYIGETEKNLHRIFAEAETSNAILFFDEADALFGKRSEVKDAHDRYANIETAYLLQKMEEYSGVVILATNLKMNLDEAFMRRMHFVIDFPMPEEDDRRRIWEAALPLELPLAPDVDLAFLARKFKLAGGHIRNIVLAASFLAAADGLALTMPHLIQATRREFQKIGRMITPTDFESYYEQ